jgi:predicted nucleic acid-binding protein
MGPVTLDASVILSWLLGDKARGRAAGELMEFLLREQVEIIAPRLLVLEVVNVLRWRYSLTEQEVGILVQRLEDLDINWTDDDLDTEQLIDLVFSHSLTAYDAWYFLTARHNGGRLITYDKVLLKVDGKQCLTPEAFMKEVYV